jgi:hypothetical protein
VENVAMRTTIIFLVKELSQPLRLIRNDIKTVEARVGPEFDAMYTNQIVSRLTAKGMMYGYLSVAKAVCYPLAVVAGPANLTLTFTRKFYRHYTP